MVTIIDYGSGNLRSVQKAMERVGVEARITDEVDRVHREYRRDLVPLQQAVVLYSDRDARR